MKTFKYPSITIHFLTQYQMKLKHNIYKIYSLFQTLEQLQWRHGQKTLEHKSANQIYNPLNAIYGLNK
jgi:hypothetical protein